MKSEVKWITISGRDYQVCSQCEHTLHFCRCEVMGVGLCGEEGCCQTLTRLIQEDICDRCGYRCDNECYNDA